MDMEVCAAAIASQQMHASCQPGDQLHTVDVGEQACEDCQDPGLPLHWSRQGPDPATNVSQHTG